MNLEKHNRLIASNSIAPVCLEIKGDFNVLSHHVATSHTTTISTFPGIFKYLASQMETQKTIKKATATNTVNQSMVHLYLCYMCAVNLKHTLGTFVPAQVK